MKKIHIDNRLRIDNEHNYRIDVNDLTPEEVNIIIDFIDKLINKRDIEKDKT